MQSPVAEGHIPGYRGTVTASKTGAEEILIQITTIEGPV